MSRRRLLRAVATFAVATGVAGCSAWRSDAALSDHPDEVLQVRSGKGAELLRVQAESDATLAGWVAQHGNPDYVRVESAKRVELCYIAQDRLVTFTRGWTARSSASVSEPIPDRLRQRFARADQQRLSAQRAPLPAVPRAKPKRAASAKAAPKTRVQVPAKAADVPAALGLRIDERDEPYRAELVRMVEKIERENGRCARAGSVTRSISQGTPSDPAWFATCTDRKGSEFDVFFSRSDIRSGKSMAAAPHLAKSVAIERCKKHALSISTQTRKTAFAWSDPHVEEYPDGRTRVTTSFEARSASGLEEKLGISCLMDTGELFEANITP